MNFNQFYTGRVIGLVVVLAVVLGFFAVWKLHTPASIPLNITTTAGNYGLFIDNQDNEYFSTKDANVRNIIQAYLARGKDYLYELTDAEKYGYLLVYYYTKDVFLVAEKGFWHGPITAFVMRDMKTGQKISDCTIFASAGLYKDNDIILSASSLENGEQGVCLYERGAQNFTFIDLGSKLSSTVTLFNDPAGRNLKAKIKDVDTQKKKFSVDVYDTTKKDADGNYSYKRSMEVSY